MINVSHLKAAHLVPDTGQPDGYDMTTAMAVKAGHFCP